MERKKSLSHTKEPQIFQFGGELQKFSKFQPINIKPRQGQDWILNGNNNANFIVYQDAYNDSPTNSAIIDAYVSYMFGEGLIDLGSNSNLRQYVSDEDMLLMCHEFKKFGGYAYQIVWGSNKKPLRIKYVPVYKLGIRYNMESLEVVGYWYSYDWQNRYKYTPKFYPKFCGYYQDNPVEVCLVRNPTSEPFFPVPDYLAGIPWAEVEGELGNAAISHFKNGIQSLTIVNYNQGRQETTELARIEADKVRKMVTGSENTERVIVSFNDSIEEAVTLDRIPPTELNNQNVFFAEEAERKLIVAHSAPPILFPGSNKAGGFSNNADEMALATKTLYRKKINPMRQIFVNGLKPALQLIDATINPWFKDFEEEKELENNTNND